MGILQASLAEAAATSVALQERRRQNPELAISRDEAAALLTLDRQRPEAGEAWRRFMASAVADHVVGSEPAGTLTEAKIGWLMAAAAPGGAVETAAAFETMVCVVERAGEGATSLAACAIRQLRAAVIRGEGPAIGPRPHFSRVIDQADTALLHRILTAAGGRAGMPVTHAEADALFDLHDAVARSENDPAFNELFVHAIAHYTFAASGCAVEPRAAALTPGFVVRADLRPSEAMAAWLAERITRDGRPTLAEFELLLMIGVAPASREHSLRRLLESA